MEKKFKNNIAVKGSRRLLQAFADELREELDYENGWPESPANNNYHLLLNIGTNSSYEWHSHNGGDKTYNLPEQWFLALEKASETEEVPPEYIRVTQKEGWYTPEVGKIFPVYGIDDKYTFGNAYYVDINKSKWVMKKDCLPALKSEYEAQQNAPKYKVGDFYLVNDSELRYIHKIEDSFYHFYQEIPGYYSGNNSHLSTWEISCRKVPDEEALKLLKAHYAKQGIVEGARIRWRYGHCTYEYKITGLDLVKRTSLLPGNNGNSQLPIFTRIGGVTPTRDGFKVLPKEVKVAGHRAEIQEIHKDKVPKLLYIGCQPYTRESLLTIRDIIQDKYGNGNGWVHQFFSNQKGETIAISKSELLDLIEMFNQ